MNLGSTVWSREETGHRNDTLSERDYVGAIVWLTTLGLAVSAGMGTLTRNWEPNIFAYLGVGLGLPIVGMLIALFSKDWKVSLLGFGMIVTGLGAILGPAVALYDKGSILAAVIATGGVTFVMSCTGMMYRKSLEHWGGYLFGALIAILFALIAQSILSAMGAPMGGLLWKVISIGAVIVFSLYIMYDWNRALRLPHTLDNAVDVAVAIYLDIINLFIWLLRIFGGNHSGKD